MVAIDLKPLSEETIQEMGYEAHDLWLVKIDSVVFGPFETETLKHYVQDNEQLFDGAEASRTDEAEWKPFWSHTKFQRRKPQVVSGQTHEGPFWILDLGVKAGPFGFRDIDKKLEMGLLGMTDHLSVDNGETWIKIFEIADFDRRTHVPDELPVAPLESTLQKGRLELVDVGGDERLATVEGLAGIAWESKARILSLKLDELTPLAAEEPLVSPAMKYAAPVAATLVVALIGGAYLFSQDEAADLSLAAGEETKVYRRPSPAAGVGEVTGGQIRMPASAGYARPSAGFQQTEHSRYPTQVITHEDANNDLPPAEHFDQQSPDAQPAQEHSLVTENTGAAEETSLDATMNTPAEAAAPVVEESSDF
jgi:hypothetical protein